MDAEDDEIDILGDFDLENLLTPRDRRQTYSFSSNDNYCLTTADWILDNSSPLFNVNVKSILTSDQINHVTSSPGDHDKSVKFTDSNFWTDKEKSLLAKGLDLFGKSYVSLSQYIGTKDHSQVKKYLRNHHPKRLELESSYDSLNQNYSSDDIDIIPSTVEVVVSSLHTTSTTSSNTSSSSDSDIGKRSTFYPAGDNVWHEKSKIKCKKNFVKKRPLPTLISDDSDDDLDYENTNIIFKPRKLSKYHLMVKNGDQVLPSGEQVVRIKREDVKSDIDVNIIESEDDSDQDKSDEQRTPRYSLSKNQKAKIDHSDYHPDSGITVISRIQPHTRRKYLDATDEPEVDVVDAVDIGLHIKNHTSKMREPTGECSKPYFRQSNKKRKTSTERHKKRKFIKTEKNTLNTRNSIRNSSYLKKKQTKNRKSRKIHGNNDKKKKIFYKHRICNLLEKCDDDILVHESNSVSNSEVDVEILSNSQLKIVDLYTQSTADKDDEVIDIMYKPIEKETDNNQSEELFNERIMKNMFNIVGAANNNNNSFPFVNDVEINKNDENNDLQSFSTCQGNSLQIVSENTYIQNQNHFDCQEKSNIVHVRNHANNLQSKTGKNIKKKNIIFKEMQFNLESKKLIHLDDLINNYDFSNIAVLDHSCQMERIRQLLPAHINRLFNDFISVEEIDYNRDFFQHNDPYFIKRFLKIRNHILKEWNSKKPNHVNKTCIISGLRHCGNVAFITRIHYYLEQRGFINSDDIYTSDIT